MPPMVNLNSVGLTSVKRKISVMNLPSAVTSRMLREPVLNCNCTFSSLNLFNTASNSMTMR